MTTETALTVVRCPQHGNLVQRPLDRQTPEQKWCGTWWDCPKPGCYYSTLFESEDCRRQRAELGRGQAELFNP